MQGRSVQSQGGVLKQCTSTIVLLFWQDFINFKKEWMMHKKTIDLREAIDGLVLDLPSQSLDNYKVEMASYKSLKKDTLFITIEVNHDKEDEVEAELDELFGKK